MHSVVVTAANVADVTQVDKLLHGEENVVCTDAGYTGVDKREEHKGRSVIWQVAARRSTYKKYGKRSLLAKSSARSRKPRPRFAPRLSIHFR